MKKVSFCLLFFFLIIFTTHGKETVPLPDLPRRILIAGADTIGLSNTLFLFPEASERVIAIGGEEQNPFLPLIDPLYDRKTRLSSPIDKQTIRELNPDLVVTEDPRILPEEFLASQGIGILTLNPDSPENWNKTLQILGEVFDNPRRAAELQDLSLARIEKVTGTQRQRCGNPGNRILILEVDEIDGKPIYRIPSYSSILTRALEAAEGIPVWSKNDGGEKWVSVEFEEILSWYPDMIFLISRTIPPEKIWESGESREQWNQLWAFREGEIYPFPKDFSSWDHSGPRWLLSLQWMAFLVSPGTYFGLDMKNEAREFFREFYGIDETTFQNRIRGELEGLFTPSLGGTGRQFLINACAVPEDEE